MPLSPARVFKAFRYAMYFDGIDDYVGIPRSDSLNVVNISIFMWVYQFKYYPSLGEYLDRNDYYALGLINGRVYSWLRLPVRSRVGATELPLHQWVFIGVTYDGVTRKHYANGRLDAQWVESAPLALYNSLRLIIGANANDTDTYLVAPSGFKQTYIAQVLIYSRALSDSEVKFNYSNPDNPIRNGLVLWLQADPAYIRDIDGDGVPEWLDLSGFNNHGKIYGASLVELIKTPARTLTATRTLPVAR
jgi:hypothetical protein